jgi:hypothetical protein
MVEFALIATPLFMILLGLTDFGYRSYVASVVEGTVHRAARLATVGNKTPTQIDDYIKNELSHFSDNGTVTIDKKYYYQFSNVEKKEPITKDLNGNGVVDIKDECWLDIIPGEPDDQPGSTSRDGLGGSDDIVFYKVTLDYPRLLPLGSWFGWSAIQSISASTLMRNQPYGSQVTPPEKCKS